MEMKRIVVLFIVGAMLFPAPVQVAQAGKTLIPKVREPRSDVPVTADIGWWPYQNALSVDDLKIEVVDERLSAFNHRALVRYRIRGHIVYREGWRPFIEKAHVSERFRSGAGRKPIGDILITPVVKAIEDRTYMGKRMPFEISIEKVMETTDWGENHYEVRCGNVLKDFSLTQDK